VYNFYDIPEAIEHAQQVADGSYRSAYLVQYGDTIQVYRQKPVYRIMMRIQPNVRVSAVRNNR
jgi:hypothetical protein